MTVSTPVIQVILENINQPSVPLADGLRVQVLPDMSYLPTCKKHQSAAFIADCAVMVVWDDDPYSLLERVESLVAQTLSHIWGRGVENETKNEKDGIAVNVDELSDIQDLEHQEIEPSRPLVLVQAFITAFCLALAISAIGVGWGKIAQEINIDGSYLRVALAACVPLQIWAGLFFFQSIGTNICQLIGPVKQMSINSKFYSALPTKRLSIERDGSLPHVTIQCPVYKEGLAAVIEPTVRSIKAAISTYEMQGGTANIFVNDDGMQLLSEDEAIVRQNFYEENNIGWVARPRHDPKGDHGIPFLRRGKFKKASNMNYALWVSNRVEDKMAAVGRSVEWTQTDEAESYKSCLMDVVVEDEGRTWTDGNIRVGDYVLLIDSDTRVPKDCLLDAVSELEASPQVAILQYASGVMNITSSFFEKGITFFTNMVYTQIRYAVANGDVAPFVGHNAILRWSAVQEIAYECPDDGGREKYWSESTVSEDFDMALRLQAEGYILRLGGYTGDGFQEGVSLTVYDELARWEKYAYGCSELIFHPLRYWFTRGPFTPLFRRFLRSRIPLASKITIVAYIGTYYALASAWILTLVNYFIVGWFLPKLDEYYLHSFQIWISVVVIFSGFGNIALAVMRYRIGERSFISALIENFTWIPLLMIFLGGVSLHVSQAILSHLFSIDMSWGATAKEVENVSPTLQNLWAVTNACRQHSSKRCQRSLKSSSGLSCTASWLPSWFLCWPLPLLCSGRSDPSSRSSHSSSTSSAI